MNRHPDPAEIAGDAAFVRQVLLCVAASKCAETAEQSLRDLAQDASDECLATLWKLMR